MGHIQDSFEMIHEWWKLSQMRPKTSIFLIFLSCQNPVVWCLSVQIINEWDFRLFKNSTPQTTGVNCLLIYKFWLKTYTTPLQLFYKFWKLFHIISCIISAQTSNHPKIVVNISQNEFFIITKWSQNGLKRTLEYG